MSRRVRTTTYREQRIEATCRISPPRPATRIDPPEPGVIEIEHVTVDGCEVDPATLPSEDREAIELEAASAAEEPS